MGFKVKGGLSKEVINPIWLHLSDVLVNVGQLVDIRDARLIRHVLIPLARVTFIQGLDTTGDERRFRRSCNKGQVL